MVWPYSVSMYISTERTSSKNSYIDRSRIVFFLFSYIALLNWHTETRIICHKTLKHVGILKVCLIHSKCKCDFCSTVALLGLLNATARLTKYKHNSRTVNNFEWWNDRYSCPFGRAPSVTRCEPWARKVSSRRWWPVCRAGPAGARSTTPCFSQSCNNPHVSNRAGNTL